MKKLKVRLTFIEDMLGTNPANSEIYEEFIASKAPDSETRKEEVENFNVQEETEKRMTIFQKSADGTPFIYNYMIRGFFKEACSCLRKVKGTKSEKLKAFKKEIDGLIFVYPREIPLDLHGMMLSECSRSLRADTPQGSRTALAKSEAAPAGTTIEFEVKCLSDDDVELVKEWLEYGIDKGLGQWRNSGCGSFTVEYLN